MAGDWIKVEHTTPDKPEVVKLAGILGIDQDAVVGKLLRLWIWADQQSVSGNAITVTNSFLDRLVFCPGFAAGLVKVGWLNGREGLLSIPNFDRHNGQSAKNRANTNRRVANSRKAHHERVAKTCNENVTLEPLQKPLPEKRREDNTTTTTTTGREVCQFPKDVTEVDRFMAAQVLHPLGDELPRCAERFFQRTVRRWMAKPARRPPGGLAAHGSPIRCHLGPEQCGRARAETRQYRGDPAEINN